MLEYRYNPIGECDDYLASFRIRFRCNNWHRMSVNGRGVNHKNENDKNTAYFTQL